MLIQTTAIYSYLLAAILVKSVLCNEQEQGAQQHEQQQQQQQQQRLQAAMTTSPVVQPASHDPHSESHYNPYWKHLNHMSTSLVKSSQDDASGYPVLSQAGDTQAYTEAMVTETNSHGNQTREDQINVESKEPSQLMGFYRQPHALFDHHVVHTEQWSTRAPQRFDYEYRKRRFVDSFRPKSIDSDRKDFDDHSVDNDRGKKSIIRRPAQEDDDDDHTDTDTDDDDDDAEAVAVDGKAATSKGDAFYRNRDRPVHETRSFHDIYMRVAGPNARNLFGHVEHGPDLFQRRFQSVSKGNRFRGEVLWADKTGGYGAHHWDLAQGKL